MRSLPTLLTAALLTAGLIAAAAQPATAAEIRGKVTDAQGAAVAHASIIAEQDGASTLAAETRDDGEYAIAELPPGRYVLRARKAGFLEQRQGPVEIAPASAIVTVNFRLAASGEPEAVRGAEERNPNDFIIRLDTNAIQNELARTGTSLRMITEFRADRPYFGEPFGYGLRNVDYAAPGRLAGNFHGSVYEFHQDNHFNARPFFQVGSLLPSRRNQYGFSVSGPVVRDRLSFLFAWGQVRDSGFVNGNAQVPLASERTPRSDDPQKNAIIAALLKAYPDELPNLPQVSSRDLNTNGYRNISSTAFSTHLDATLRGGDRLAVDQNFSDSAEDPFELVIGQNPRTEMRPQSVHLLYTHRFSPNVVGQIGANYDRLAAVLTETKRYKNLLASLGIADVPDIEFSDELSPIGMPSQGIPRNRYENHYLLAPQAAYSGGRHTLSAGFSVKHLWDSDKRSSNGRGTLQFSRDTVLDPNTGQVLRTASAIENFLLGQPSRLQLSIGSKYRGYRNWEYSAFFQDRFQWRESLQLSFGLRYEALTKPREVNNLFEFIHDTDANNFAPQVGFAWKPPLGGGVVVRGGYGIAFGTLTVATWNRQATNPPLVQSLSVDRPSILEVATIGTLTPVPGRKSGYGSLDKDAALPYAHIYNLSIERELPGAMLLRAGYEGVRTYKLFSGLALNRAVPVPGIVADTGNVNARRPDQRFQRIYNIVNASVAYHDGLQVGLTKRRTRGLTFDLRYSYSKTMDSGASDFADTGNGGDVSQTEVLFPDLKSLAAFDTPHSLLVNYSYELPRLSLPPGSIAGLLQRWTFSATSTFRSGTPFAIYTGSDGPGSGNIDGEGSDRPNLLDPSVLGRSVDDPDTSVTVLGADTCRDVAVSPTVSYKQCRYFDTNLAVGGRGNIGYRVFRKDGTNNWNFAVGRSFTLPGSGPERQVQFRADFYNLFNHAQFSAPGNSITSQTFGRITNTVNKGRVMQWTLRLLF